jgi:phosphatidylinositol alpha-1,6-mannosyltransferase
LYTAELVAALRRRGCEVEIVTCLQAGSGEWEGCQTTGLAPTDPAAMAAHEARWPRALEVYLDQREASEDLVVAANPLTLPQVGPYSRRHDKAQWTFFYGVEAWGLYDSLKSELRRGGTVISISRYTADAICQQVTPASGPIRLLLPPVDTARFFPVPRPSRRPRRLLTVSRLGPSDWFKGHDVVLAALRWWSEQLDEALEYWIVGEGERRAVLEARARELGVAEQVRFLGFVDADELAACYQEADVFVMPSVVGRQPSGIAAGEGFGMVFVEAAACGCPVVGLAHGGAGEAIAHGVSGLALATPEEVPAAVLDLLRDPDECRRLGREGAAWATARFALPVFDARVEDLLLGAGFASPSV